jgi:hypothetical protein
VLQALGGGGIHWCGSGQHWQTTFLDSEGLTCIDWGNPERLTLAAWEAPMRERRLPATLVHRFAGPQQHAHNDYVQALLERGVYVNLVLPPATPDGGALLRCSMSAGHTPEQIDQIAEAFAETLRPRPRELTDFAGDFRPEPGSRSAAVGRPPAESATALALLREDGVAVTDQGNHLAVDFSTGRTLVMLAVSLLLSTALAAILLDLHAAGWAPGSTATVHEVSAWLLSMPGAEPSLDWLLAWHPWSTLLVATTPLPLLWQWVWQEPRSLRVSRAGIHAVFGLVGRAREIPVHDKSTLRVESGRVYLDHRVVSSHMLPSAAVALGRLLAPQLGCNLSIPNAGR